MVTLGPRQVGFQDLPSIMSIGLERTWNHDGAFAWYDLLAGFADRGYVFKITNLRQTQAVKNRLGGLGAFDARSGFKGAACVRCSLCLPLPPLLESTPCPAEGKAEDKLSSIENRS